MYCRTDAMVIAWNMTRFNPLRLLFSRSLGIVCNSFPSASSIPQFPLQSSFENQGKGSEVYEKTMSSERMQIGTDNRACLQPRLASLFV